MAKPALTIIQEFPYRGLPEEFSNKYHFTGPAPGDSASWKALADTVINALRPCFGTEVKFVRAYGYTDGDHPSIWSNDYKVPGPPQTGSGTYTAGPAAAGDAAAFIAWTTSKRNSRGKVVYARKYFHAVHASSTTAGDTLLGAQATAMQTFATACLNGTISSVFHLCLPDGTPALAGGPNGWITTRTLKRRGKRPPT